MSISETHDLRRELLLEQAVGTCQDDLVRLATEVVLTLPDMPENKLEESQLRNLLAVATGTTSVEVIANFIRYQIGRAPKNWGTGEKEFGRLIIQHLYGPIQKAASKVAKAVAVALEQKDDQLHQDAYIVLIRQYIGYLNRAFYFYNKAKNKKDAVKELERVIKKETSGEQ